MSTTRNAPFKVRTAAEQVADYYVVNHDVIPPSTYGELASAWGTNTTAVREGLRVAEDIMHTTHEAITVPRRVSGWQVQSTDDLETFQVSTLDRGTYIATELTRYAANEAALAQAGDVTVWADVLTAIEAAVAHVETLV